MTLEEAIILIEELKAENLDLTEELKDSKESCIELQREVYDKDDEIDELESKWYQAEDLIYYKEELDLLIESNVNFKLLINQMKLKHILDTWDNIEFDLTKLSD